MSKVRHCPNDELKNAVSPQFMKKKTIIGLCYLLIAAFTYGYEYNLELKLQTAHFPNWQLTNRNDATMSGILAGALWPIYWPLHASRVMWANAPDQRPPTRP